MNDEKWLNLSDVELEDFEAIDRAVEDWKDSGLPGQFTFVSDEVLKEAFNRGVWRGGLALVGGIAAGVLIGKVVGWFED